MSTGIPYFPITLPANSVVGRLASGPGPTEAIPFAALAAAIQVAATGSALVGFQQKGTGSVARTAQSVFYERVSVFDFLTAAQIADVRAWTFTLDCTAGIQAWINYCQTLFGVQGVMPAGGYMISARLRVSNSFRWHCEGISVTSSDSAYTTSAGAPNVLAMGAVIWQSAINTDGLLVQQTSTGTYDMVFHLENVLFIGAITIGGVGPGGATGNGITVDAGSASFGIRCVWKNVYAGNWRGYGIYLKEGYYGSSFENWGANGCSLTGVKAAGTSQGETSSVNLRCFGNGASGATEPDQAGVYWQSGGAGVSFYRTSCTSNYRVQFYMVGTVHTIVDFQSESFQANNAGDSCIIFSGCQPMLSGANFNPQTGFLGKVLNLKNTSPNGLLLGLKFQTTVDPTGYHVYEEAGSATNLYHVLSANGTIYKQIQPYSMFGAGADAFRARTATNNNAATGTIGQVVPASLAQASAVTLVSGAAKTVFNITILAGDWDVDIVVHYILNNATTTLFRSGISTTDNTLPGYAAGSGLAAGPQASVPLVVAGNSSIFSHVVGTVRANPAADTVYYIVAEATFSGTGITAFGNANIRAPR